MAKNKGKILIIDDDPDVLTTARMILRPHFDLIQTEKSPKSLQRILEASTFDVIILDMNFKTGATSGNEGLFWLSEILATDPEAHVVMNTAYGDISLAVESMKKGAIDFLIKPWEKEKLLVTVKNVFRMRQSRNQIKRLNATQQALSDDMARQHSELLYASHEMEAVESVVRKVAATDASVLITGENGTGKEVVAREIHRRSDRSDQPFIKVDLGSLNGQLIQSELFGYVKGAFTDARENRIGRFELASGGTLFLDEIGNIPPDVQVTLLSVLQNRTVYRVGDNKPIPVDIRLLCATNMALDEMIAEGTFRQDLLYRLNTVEIELPPLRSRRADIPLLARHFLAIYAAKYRKETLGFDLESMDKMEGYSWPGNVRELQHAIERAVIMAEGKRIQTGDLLLKQKKQSTPDSLNVGEIEKEAIRRAIDKHDGNISSAARELGMGRTTLYRKLEKYNLTFD